MISAEYGDVVIPRQFNLEIDAPVNLTFKILDSDDLFDSRVHVGEHPARWRLVVLFILRQSSCGH